MQKMTDMPEVVIIGAGAAGMFCAGELRKKLSGADITVLEAGKKSLAKVAVTGGGRCNLTNSFEGITSLREAYPRGWRIMKRALKAFTVEDTLKWFRNRGVRFTLQEDHCWFPVSQDAMEIVRTLQRAASGAKITLGTRVRRIEKTGDGFTVTTDGKDYHADAVVLTTGGMPKTFSLLEGLGIETEPPVPSLFTFRIKDPVTSLMGLVIENASAAIPGTKFRTQGPLLITDWGMSGPSILKLSSYAARHLAENGYRAPLSVNWLNANEEEARERIAALASQNPQKLVSSVHPEEIPSRLWSYLTSKSGAEGRRWAELGKSGVNRLCNCMINDGYDIEGRAAFKEEFVTCGGVSLSEINPATMESKKHPGLYFAGEVLDIDAITGGFNLQAAWSTAWCVTNDIIAKYAE